MSRDPRWRATDFASALFSVVLAILLVWLIIVALRGF